MTTGSFSSVSLSWLQSFKLSFNISNLFLGGMDGGQNYYDQIWEYDGMLWKLIGQMSIARKAHAVSVVSYESVCPNEDL